MTTEDLLWNATFERDEDIDDSYNYDEEQSIERYHENKDLFERFAEMFRPKEMSQ